MDSPAARSYDFGVYSNHLRIISPCVQITKYFVFLEKGVMLPVVSILQGLVEDLITRLCVPAIA